MNNNKETFELAFKETYLNCLEHLQSSIRELKDWIPDEVLDKPVYCLDIVDTSSIIDDLNDEFTRFDVLVNRGTYDTEFFVQEPKELYNYKGFQYLIHVIEHQIDEYSRPEYMNEETSDTICDIIDNIEDDFMTLFGCLHVLLDRKIAKKED